MDLHLIDVPANYYEDELFFKDPSELNKIFNALEEDNLFNIHQLQEKELALESLHQKELEIRATLDQKVIAQEDNRQELTNKINEAGQSLLIATKKTTGDLLYQPPDSDQIKKDAKKGKDAKPTAVDFEKFLAEISSEI